MAKAFSILSWNVEHFQGESKRINDVVDLISSINPDVFAIYEVQGKEVFTALTAKMPNYNFHITEGSEVQEILVAARNKLTTFFTQRTEFNSGNSLLRPGALLTVTIGKDNYSLLFLHTKSGSDPIGLGLRDDMFNRACEFRKTLDKATGTKWSSKFMFLGDFNTMGMKYPFGKDIDAEVELKKLAEKNAKSVKMKMLAKDEEFTWWNGTGSSMKKSNLDQVIATENLSFKKYGNAEITVLGWPKEATDAKKTEWINRYSDHGIMYLEVQK